MNEHAAASEQTSSTGQRLRANAMGPADLAFFVIAAAAPLTVMAGVAPIAIQIGGLAAPLGYVLGGLVLMVFAVGYTTMSRYVRNAGAFYSYISRGVGTRIGAGAAMVAVLSYNLIEIGLLAALAFFMEQTFANVLGLQVPWQPAALVAIAVIGMLGYFKITLSARILGVALILEVAVLLLLEGGVIASQGVADLSAASLDPTNLFGASVGAMLVITVGAFLGFESTTIYAEEVRRPRRSIPQATYAAVVFLALFYGFTVWMIINAFGDDQALAIAGSDRVADMVFIATEQSVGPWAADAMRLLIVTSAFAAVLAWHNSSARYMFALGREGLLPRTLARTSSRTGAPVVAVLVQSGLALTVIVVGIAFQADPFLVILLWTNGPGILGVVALQAMTAIAIIGFFWRDRRGNNRGRTVVAPALSFLGLATFVYLMAANMELLTAASALINTLLLLLLPAAFAFGVFRARQIRRTDPARYSQLGAVDVEEAVEPTDR